MASRVVLHIGAMKTGTSFVQSVLGRHPEQLAAAGVGFLGSFVEQMRAVQDGLRGEGNFRGWRDLVAGATDHGTSVISMEFLSFAGPERIAAFLDPLRDHEIRIVVTVRDQLAVLPAQWQSHARNFGIASWDDYLREVCAPKPARRESRAYRTYHRAQDLPQIVRLWAGRPEVSGVHVVTVPPSGAPRDELWLRFCRAADIAVSGIDVDAASDNVSIGYASCDALRRLNSNLFGRRPGVHRRSATAFAATESTGRPGKGVPGYRRLIRAVVRESLAPLRADETKPVVDRDAALYAVARNAELRDVLEAERLELIGSSDDLPVHVPASAPPPPAPPPPPEQVLRAAEAMWDHLAQVSGNAAAKPGRLNKLTSDSARMLLALAEKR